MYAVIRKYSDKGAALLFHELETKKGELVKMMHDIPGFIAYTLVRTQDGGLSITVCQDKEGTDESTRWAAAWIRENVPNVTTHPEVTEGNVILEVLS
jgi:hypothetical protein